MKTRLVAFARVGNVVLFAVPDSGALSVDLADATLDDVARANGFVRHGSFDWAAGDAGARCALVEFPAAASTEALPAEVALGSNTWRNARWLSFPVAARALSDGADRRYLQLAVQYVSSGGVVEDNVIAADADAGLLGQLGKALEEKAGPGGGSESP
jgi:hypothetical protein